MPRGRPPKPVEQKRRTGNPGKRALPEPVAILPASPVDVPAVPEHLDEAGQAAWVRLWTASHSWLSPTTDIDLLIRLCEYHDEREELRALVAENGRTARGAAGGVITHPYLKQLKQVDADILTLERECGFTPTARSRLGLAEVKKQSKLEELIAKRQGRTT